jgi:hypothetical protein
MRLFLVFFVLVSTLSWADCTYDDPFYCQEDECCGFFDGESLLELKVGYFYFLDDRLNRVYDGGGFDTQLSYTHPFSNYLNVYASVEYLVATGKSLGARERTVIQEVPLSLGIQPFYYINPCLKAYFTAGPRYFFVFQRNYSAFVDHHVYQDGIGFFLNLGFMYQFYENFYVDLFGEYSYGKLRFHAKHDDPIRDINKFETGHCVDVGGITGGIGFGVSF